VRCSHRLCEAGERECPCAVLRRAAAHRSWSKKSSTEGVVSPVSVPSPSICVSGAHISRVFTGRLRHCSDVLCPFKPSSSTKRRSRHTLLATCNNIQLQQRRPQMLTAGAMRSSLAHFIVQVDLKAGRVQLHKRTRLHIAASVHDSAAQHVLPRMLLLAHGSACERPGRLRHRTRPPDGMRGLPERGLRQRAEAKHPRAARRPPAECRAARLSARSTGPHGLVTDER